MNDPKLELFFDKDVFSDVISKSVEKGISAPVSRWFTVPENRVKLCKLFESDGYAIAPPHIILIPKRDSTEMRKVYCNEQFDRVVCALLGEVYGKYYADRIHPLCVSYQKGVGVSMIVKKISRYIVEHPGLKGAKFDIHHYFDDISEEARDSALKELDSGSCLDKIVWEYLHDDTVIDEEKNIIHQYKGIAQGFAVSPFLANYILRDIDEAISKLDVLYYRYSDDILILGRDFEKAKAILYDGLKRKGLTVSAKKVQPIDADTWFTFLGFKIKGGVITFSDDAMDGIKKLVKEECKCEKGKPIKNLDVIKKAIKRINNRLYVAYLKNDREFGWAEYMFGTVNLIDDIDYIDKYIKDHLRHLYTGKWNSYSNYNKVTNDTLRELGYISMVHLFKLYKTSKPLYRNEVRMKCA